MTLTTLVTGKDAQSREAAIARALALTCTDAAYIIDGERTAVILEGLPTGASVLDEFSSDAMQLVRIAPACMCCSGNLTFRVTLNRVLRSKPARLYLGLASTDHLGAIRDFLTAAPYETLLQLTSDLHA